MRSVASYLSASVRSFCNSQSGIRFLFYFLLSKFSFLRKRMNLTDLANLGQIIGAIGVMITLVYLAIQIRGNTKVASAQARHSISEFVLRISIFRAEHADRFAKLESGAELTDGDRSVLESCPIAAACRDVFS